MEMECIYCYADIVAVNSFYYVVSCAELVDGAVRSAAEFQRDFHIAADFIGKVAQSVYSFFFDFANRFVFYVERRNCDEHFHANSFGNFHDEINFVVNFLFACSISLIEENQSIVCPRF